VKSLFACLLSDKKTKKQFAGGANALIALRVLEGIGEGTTFPGICDVSARFLLISHVFFLSP
jgi:hypothetical protein